jgi:hypothetical protein
VFLVNRQMYREYQKSFYQHFSVIFENIFFENVSFWETERYECFALPESTSYLQHVCHAIMYRSINGIRIDSNWNREFARFPASCIVERFVVAQFEL